MRAIWTGILSFSLINIPIRLYHATNEEEIEFNLLHKKDLSPIRYIRICSAEEKEIPYDDIVKGYEYQKGQYVVMEDKDFKKINPLKSKLINILEFVIEEQVDSVYYEKPYFLAPNKGAEKHYILLREAIKKSKKVGVAKFVMKNREHLGIIKSYENIMVLMQLRYESEIKNPHELNLLFKEEISISSSELDRAVLLINQLTGTFKPKQYHDTYVEELKNVIEEKKQGIKPKSKAKVAKLIYTPPEDLMSTLQASLKENKENKEKKKRKIIVTK
ncbi:MAG: Ku protein [Oligoflexia bacterium]|nr:Ku protein [Oligoflexia bacterium]